MKGDVHKEYWAISDELRDALRVKETKEEVDKYFEHLVQCRKDNVCSECGQEVVIDELWTKHDIKELGISAMCRRCQYKVFGV